MADLKFSCFLKYFPSQVVSTQNQLVDTIWWFYCQFLRWLNQKLSEHIRAWKTPTQTLQHCLYLANIFINQAEVRAARASR